MSYGGNSGSGGSIASSTDAALNNPETGHVLTYNATIQKWQNESIAATENLADVATTGSYSDLVDRPPIPYYGWQQPTDPSVEIWNDTSTVPPRVQGVVATPGSARVDLTWTPLTTTVLIGPPVTDYKIQYREVGEDTWVEYADTMSTTPVATVTGLTNGTSYEFRVAGVNTIGVGSYSTIVSSAAPTDPYAFYDNFDRIDGALANGWAVRSGTLSSVAVIRSNELKIVSTSVAAFIYNTNGAASPNMRTEFQITNAGSVSTIGSFSLVSRYDSVSNSYYYFRRIGTGFNFGRLVNNGSATNVGSTFTGIVPAVGDTMAFETVELTTGTVTLLGYVKPLNATEYTLVGTATDTQITSLSYPDATAGGFRLHSNSVDATIGYFAVKDI